MQLVLTEDQELLAKTAADFVAERSPVARMRQLRDSRRCRTASPARSGRRWPSSAGWGSRSRRRSAAPAWASPSWRSCSRRSAASSRPSRSFPAVLLAGQALLLGGSDAQKSRWLPPLVAGEQLLALGLPGDGAAATTCAGSRPRRSAPGEGWRLARREDPGARAAPRRRLRRLGAHRRRASATPPGSRCSWCRAARPGSRSCASTASTRGTRRCSGSTGCGWAPPTSSGRLDAGGDLLESRRRPRHRRACAPRCSARCPRPSSARSRT